MTRTPLTKYFSQEVADKLKQLYAIKCTEQLVSLATNPDTLDGVAKTVGMDDKDFQSIIQKAGQEVTIPKHSGRKYPTGALPPKKK